MSRTYPFTAYVLTPAMQVKKVELVECGRYTKSLHFTARGHSYCDGSLHDTPQSAISAGHAKLAAQRSKLQVQQANIEKRAANLAKAEASQ